MSVRSAFFSEVTAPSGPSDLLRGAMRPPRLYPKPPCVPCAAALIAISVGGIILLLFNQGSIVLCGTAVAPGTPLTPPLAREGPRSAAPTGAASLASTPASPTEGNSSQPLEFEGCGYWQHDYIQLHRDILEGRSPARFAVSVAVEAGLADRLIGVISEFYYALLTRRAFQITAGNQPAFEAIWESPHIQWSRTNPPDELVRHLNNRVHDAASCMGCPGLPPPDQGLTANGSYGFWYLTNVDEEATDIYENRDWTTLPDGGKAETVFISSNRGRTHIMFENPHHALQLRQWGLRPETAFACAFDFLFRPKPAVRALVAQELAAFEADPNALRIGVNVRVGDHVFTQDATPIEAASNFLECAQAIEDSRKYPGQRVIWYFISDSLNLKKLVKARHGDKVVTNTQAKIIHPNCADETVYGKGACGGAGGGDPRELGLQSAAAQLWVFSQTRYQVVSQFSGFGRAGAWLSPTRHRRTLELYEVGADRIPCGPADPTPLEISSMIAAGI